MVQNLTFVSLVASEPTHYRRHREADWRKRQPKKFAELWVFRIIPGTIEAFLLDMEAKTHVIVFDPGAEQWHVYKSFETEGMSHQQMVDYASELANEWLAQSLSDRIAAAENTEQDT